jgi:hypothetical protein
MKHIKLLLFAWLSLVVFPFDVEAIGGPKVILCTEDGWEDHCATDNLANVDISALVAYGPRRGDWTIDSFWLYFAGVAGITDANGNWSQILTIPGAGGYWSQEVKLNAQNKLAFNPSVKAAINTSPEYPAWNFYGEMKDGTFFFSFLNQLHSRS